MFLPRASRFRVLHCVELPRTNDRGATELVDYCEAENVPFTTFNTFAEILATVKNIAAGKLDVKDAATGRQ